MLSVLLLILIIIFLALVASFIPIGNENSTVRRLPWITFSIMAVNTIVFFVTLPAVATETEEVEKEALQIRVFIGQHQELLADEHVREKLVSSGFMMKGASDEIERELANSEETASEYKFWLRTAEAQTLRDELDGKLSTYKTAMEEHTWFKFGLAPNGNWKLYQLFTCAFLHADIFHLFGNLIFFFAVAFSLEDLWGRGVFLGFYLLGAAAACLPAVVSPGVGPMLGASGAISATMGAFLFRLPKTKIKLFCIQFFWLRMLITRKTPVYLVPGYIYLASYFIAQLISWYFDSKSGGTSGVAYSAHAAGFIYGAAFAMLMKVTKTEENYINPKIEAKVSFSAAPAVNNALQLLDQGEAVSAERMLRGHLAKQPNDTNALLALIQVHQATANYDQLNSAYSRLIRVHLNEQDREAALYAYDSLLSAFPDDRVDPRIPVRDWLTICEYLRERQMTREAGVEYERLVKAFPDDALTGKAAVQGGEAALAANDVERALRLFVAAQASPSLPTALANRADMGVERCEKILNHRPSWTKKPPKKQDYGRHLEEGTKQT
jgi:membrane associated rhomboid family serine protease/outer membrane protein assembly factor BamD (BamD/ComL family)